MGVMIDFHSHILPQMDDGSASAAQSIAMLRMASRQGIGCVVATPHFYPQQDEPRRFLERRSRAESLLRAEMAKYPDLPQVRMGAEVAYYRGISESELLPLLSVQGGKCILIEMPPAPWPESACRELEEIYRKWGIIPVIAHVDRYIGPFRTRSVMKALEKLPVRVQANADFFLDRSTAGLAIRLLKKGRLHVLGSDCHNTGSRKPNLGPALSRIRQKLGRKKVKELYLQAKKLL